MSILEINAQGTPYEIGYIHGKEGCDRVKKSIETYKRLFAYKSGIAWQEALKLASEFIPDIEKFSFALIEEMKGIAEGAGVAFEEILALNTRSELVFKGKGKLEEGIADGCTTMAATPEFTREGKTFVGQNWDWDGAQQEALILLRIAQPGKPKITMITEAGVIGKIGMNSAGLGLCFNALSIDRYNSGVPVHCVLRKMLECETLDDAMRVGTKTRFACSGNILLAHRTGEAVDMEKDWERFEILYPSEGYLVHTNHFAHSKMPSSPFVDTLRIAAPHSMMRFGRAEKLMKQYAGIADFGTFQTIFSDHVNMPTGICRHENKGESVTVFSIVMDLTAQKMYLCEGQPCMSAYQEYTVLK